MKNISASLTADQILDESKTVTRRLGWKNLKPGELLQVVRKAQGLKKGEHPEKLKVIRVKSVRRERLEAMYDCQYGNEEAIKEGFPKLNGNKFVEMFCKHMNCTPETEVTRIEFSYEH